MQLDEKALRRPGFSEGVRVRLGDGQDWSFPRPVLCLWPARNADGTIAVAALHGFGPDYLDRLDDLIESDDLSERIAIQLELAAGLLLRNYALDDRALRRLLPMNMDRSTNVMWSEINAVLTGASAPKPLPDGSASDS